MNTTGEHFRAVLNMAPDAMLVFDHGTIVEANEAASELFGYSIDELIGRSTEMLLPERMHHLHDKNRETFHTHPVRQPFGITQRLFALTKAGHEIPIEVTVGPVAGEPSKAIVSVRDVSDRTLREEQLRGTIEEMERRLKTSEADFRRTNEHFKLFLKNAPAAIALLDRQMRYLIVSDRWLGDYGLADRDIHGLCHYDVFPEVPERWKETHRRCLAGETIKCNEDTFERPDGHVDWLRWELHPWRNGEGRIVGMLMFSELFTARKNAEVALMKSYQQLEQRVAERTAELTVTNTCLQRRSHSAGSSKRS